MSSRNVREKELVLLKTRPGVLVRFFQKSRDKWKEKYRKLRDKGKALQVRVRDLELSRKAWRTQAEQHAEELQQLRQDIARLQHELVSSQEEQEQKPERAGRSSPRRRFRGTSSRRSKSTLS